MFKQKTSYLVYLLIMSLVLVSSCKTIEPVENISIPPGIYNEDQQKGSLVVWPNEFISSLERERRIRIYLPPKYDETTERYPVFYVQDGQNAFFDSNAAKGGWHLDSAIEAMIALELHPGAILVAIDNSAYRVQEYVPYEFRTDSLAVYHSDAAAMADYLVNELKPKIDENFRTLPDRTNTGIIGSSFGAFFAQYTAVRHKEIFGMVGAFSTALSDYTTAKRFESFLRDTSIPSDTRWFIMAGRGEDAGDSFIVFNVLKEKKIDALAYYVDPLGGHDEPTWAASCRTAIPWLLRVPVEVKPIWEGLSRDAGYYNQDGEFMAGGPVIKLTIYPKGIITFRYNGEADKVSLAGDFTGWDPGVPAYQMEKDSEGFFVSVDLPAGSYAYKFVVDGTWVQPTAETDNMFPQPSKFQQDGFGGFNSVLILE